MKNTFLTLIVCFALNQTIGQVIDRIYKENGVWKGDLSQPIGAYPIKGAIIADTSAIPDPEKPIPPVVYTNIDNIDTRIIYTPLWTHNGQTTAPGFFGNTMAYTSTAGATATLIFTGTSIEVFCEKKVVTPAHGSAKFKVDGMPEETVNMNSSGGVIGVFKRDGLPNTQHTFTLTVVGNGNVVFDYIKIDGEAITPPVPPNPNRKLLMPGVSMKTAVETASTGTEFELGNGAYPENIVNVPIGVSIFPPASGTAYIDPVGTYSGYESAIFVLSSASAANGNQTISGFTIRGAKKANGGIMVNNRQNIKILHVKVIECTFFGIWLKSTNAEVAFCELFNNSNGATPQRNWSTGEINIYNVRGINIHDNYIHSDRLDRGYGIKTLWNESPINGRIHHNTIQMFAQSTWNNGQSPNIGIELAAAIPDGIEVDHNILYNGISAAWHRSTRSGRTYIHDNDMSKLTSNSTFAVEIVGSNMTIANNVMRGSFMLGANYSPNGTNNGHWTDIIVEGNDFVNNGNKPDWGGIFLIGIGGMDITYRNNKFVTNGYTMFKHAGPTSASKIVDGGGNTFN